MAISNKVYKQFINQSINYKQSKYKNNKIVVDNIKFDSKKEAVRYQQLKLLEQYNKISDLQLQVKFELQPSFKKNGKTIRAINYISDFYYYDNELNKWIVEDSKGFRTKDYILKKKMFEYKYQDLEIKEV